MQSTKLQDFFIGGLAEEGFKWNKWNNTISAERYHPVEADRTENFEKSLPLRRPEMAFHRLVISLSSRYVELSFPFSK